MSPSTGYRAFPQSIAHPSRSRPFTADEFASLPKVKLQDAPSAGAGHAGTSIWYVEEIGYIVEIRFDSEAPVYILSICTFPPTLGMDKIDGEFAQDAEEYVLNQALGFSGQRLAVFGDSADIPTVDYLRARGYAK